MRSVIVVAAVTTAPPPVHAQRARPPDTMTVVAGPHYRAGAFHRFLFGAHYRALWTTPIAVEVLSLNGTGGGLAPTTAGGGLQTKSLRFDGANGQRYGFRSVDKDPAVLRPELQGTVVQDLVQDQISSAHPAGPAIAMVLMEAAGILHTSPRLIVLPDDAGLNQFRERFAGTLGFFEERAITDQARPFAGAGEIIASDEMFERVRRSSGDRVDSRAFLAARLFDLVIGDWDRHRGQWGWARFGDAAPRVWVPVPEDRDQAFVRYDGLMLAFARIKAPQLVNFGDDYPGMLGLTWNGREVDRYFLADLEKPVWDSVARALQARLTDSVIGAAAAAMPPAYQTIDAGPLTRALRSRRDRLAEAADRFYRLLARETAVHATDEPEVVTVERRADGSVEVAVAAADRSPYFRRRFDARETSEVRLFLYDGDDRVVVRGEGAGADLTLRVIAGAGRDVVADSSRGGAARLYTTDGDRSAGPRRVAIDRRPYQPPPHLEAQRDWGERWRGVAWSTFGPDVGLFVGGGAYRMRFGFRRFPYASRIRLRAGYATEARTGRAALLAQFTRSNSRVRFELEATASGIEVLRFHGLGNQTVLDRPDDDEFYRVNQEEYTLEPRLILPVGARAELLVGPTLTYSSTADRPGRFLATLGDVYGAGDFGQMGARARFELDTRDVPPAATRGVHFTVGASLFPEAWDVEETFGDLHGEVATYLSARAAPLAPTLALRAGGKKVWGSRFPYQESAFIGDAATIRLGRRNRFAGDAAAYGNAELRLRLADLLLVVPAQLGVFGLGDVGRVFLDGETSGVWHNAVGGGVWLAFLDRGSTVTVAVSRSEIGRDAADRRTGVYVQAGFAF